MTPEQLRRKVQRASDPGAPLTPFRDRRPLMSSTPSLTSLRAFATVGQCLSFTEGAHRLGVTQSAVSRQIRQLETALDIALFRRIGNTIELTGAGAVLHERSGLPENAMEFATLDMVTQAAVSGAGLAVIDRNMIESELGSGALVQIDPVVVTGPYGYWLDISTERLATSRVVHFARWMQQLALQGTRGPQPD